MSLSNSYIKDDLYRYIGNHAFKSFLRFFLFTPGFKYVVLFRKASMSTGIVYWFYKVLLRHYMIKYGIQIPECTKIDKGFRIVHFGNMVINPDTVIGKNFNISQGVTIGNAQGKIKGAPTIGDNVCLQPNAVVVGGVKIGNNVLIAPNAFVNFDVPDNSVVIGNPGRIIPKEQATASYIVYSV